MPAAKRLSFDLREISGRTSVGSVEDLRENFFQDRERLFREDERSRREVLALVTRLEEAIAGVLRSHGAGAAADTAGTAARLIVSGGLIELNRTRTGLAGGDPVEHRLRAMVELALAGARAAPARP